MEPAEKAVTAPRTPSLSSRLKQQIVASRKSKIIAGALIGVLLVTTIAAAAQHNAKNDDTTGTTNTASSYPEYQTVLPGKKSIDDLGGWQRVSPVNESPVFAYTDSLAGTTISVSQQPLPQSFLGNTASEVEKLATTYGATTRLEAGSTLAFLGTSSKGPQSVILTQNGLLIMIKSQKKIDPTTWTDYISSLN